jgi:hypothetical protein
MDDQGQHSFANIQIYARQKKAQKLLHTGLHLDAYRVKHQV